MLLEDESGCLGEVIRRVGRSLELGAPDVPSSSEMSGSNASAKYRSVRREFALNEAPVLVDVAAPRQVLAPS